MIPYQLEGSQSEKTLSNSQNERKVSRDWKKAIVDKRANLNEL